MQGCHIQETGEWLPQGAALWRIRTGSWSSLVALRSSQLTQHLLSPPAGKNFLTIRADHKFEGRDSKFCIPKGAPYGPDP